MATRIKLKNSTVLNKAPTTADIEIGELAINANVGSPGAYIRTSDNTIVKIAGSGVGETPTLEEVLTEGNTSTLGMTLASGQAVPFEVAANGTVTCGDIDAVNLNASADLDVDGNGDVAGNMTAAFFIGDGSQLTNLPDATQDLQSVTDQGATTTLMITTAGYNLDILNPLP